ncbi:MAG: DUF4242 domain-containing protein [Chloroflexi bacterium]|nr:DUF4242 domain-containing protein [Chloroflexota bacterium]
MPRFLDVHHHFTPGLSPEQIAAAHQRDLAVQAKYGVRFLKYWYDPATGKVFCLSEAPNREAVLAVHQEAHGDTADEIFEVFEGE